MIKINLIPQKKPKRQAEPGQKDILIGLLAVMALGVAVFFGLHRPKQAKLDELKEANDATASMISGQKKKLDGPPSISDLRLSVAEATERTATIEMLSAARAVPAHMLHELGEILTPGHMPTMLPDIANQVLDPKNETYRIDPLWNAQQVWITRVSEAKGMFTLDGGAESDADVTQLAKRLQASVFFDEVNPRGGARLTDKTTGITYYTFSITGKVVY